MTAILAVKSRGRVYIGSDRAVTCDNGQVLKCSPKAIWIGGYLVALAGSIGGHWEALQEATPANIRELCGLLGPGSEAEVAVAQRDNLWLVSWENEAGGTDGRWSACEVDGPIALGSGGLVTLGAYLARQGTVERRLRCALQITAQHIGGVTPPFDVVHT